MRATRRPAQRRGRVAAQQPQQLWADLVANAGGIFQNGMQFLRAEVARWIPAVALEIYPAILGEDDALGLQQLAHSIGRPEGPASRQLALAIDNALRRHALRRFVHHPPDHARTTR